MQTKIIRAVFWGAILLIHTMAKAQNYFPAQSPTPDRQDSLRGGYGPGRSNWDLLSYELQVEPEYHLKSISGINRIILKVLGSGKIQIDLQEPLIMDSILYQQQPLNFMKEGNVYWVQTPNWKNGSVQSMSIHYHGNPREAVNPPWDGGWIFTTDTLGRPWMSVACQSLGASSWFPCKDSQADEPDSGATLSMVVPDSLQAIANGRLKEVISLGNGKKKFVWRVVSPINNYCMIPYIGKYVNIHDEYQPEKTTQPNRALTMDYYVIDYNQNIAKKHFKKEPKLMLTAFEYWFGPFPFYEDGFKLVEAPYLGMENQSAIAYGNGFRNGYLGMDMSQTGIGLKWDYILVHESAHEWFGNSITSNDIADLWIHESFASYAEVLFQEFNFGKKYANAYCVGCRIGIDHIAPCIGQYGIQDDPSKRTSDMYWKGSNMIHTIRQVCNNDEKFRGMLHEINRKYYHSLANSSDIEKIIIEYTGIDQTVLDQYLRTTQIPVLEYSISGLQLSYRWVNTVKNFKMPVKIMVGEQAMMIYPSPSWKKLNLSKKTDLISIEDNYYVECRLKE